MDGPFAKSVSTAEKCKRLQDAAGSEDTLAIMIQADPDSIASAFALKRLFWRKVKKVNIIRIKTNRRYSHERSGRCSNTGDNGRLFHENGGGNLQHRMQIKPNAKKRTGLEQYVLNRLKRAGRS
jgi:ribosomal protein L23